MERIALISDVHGNLTALEAVLADIDARGITRIFNLVEAELAHARQVGMPEYDGYDAELRHGLYRGALEEYRAGAFTLDTYYHVPRPAS